MITTAPDPQRVREASLEELHRLRLPLPPPDFPLVWEPGDQLRLRPGPEIEARAAILNVVLARAYGLPPELGVQWLSEARLVSRLTPPEWQFVAESTGDQHAFARHVEALFALSWLLGIAMDLDPLRPADAEGLSERLPDLRQGESFEAWRRRTLVALRSASAAAQQLDLYYCLGWSLGECERRQLPPPVEANVAVQRRWALEWAVVFAGPYHGAAPGWEQVDLST
ncbi:MULTISPECIES: DUF4272 domain-containing protein [Dactylosporangium]|uniref:DUF4272 domain-containing protein n=2 Tax=Dactylosporangium TaxID=35753 RepID=A0A9W6NNI6_9ACTN|nr:MULTISPECIES: DUF4272 domain-containing protein [Dactylosporangium]UAB97472.1 DUF4272 domain-containing protein [Dactylosporangium vinaceum]UWZ45737.1 DUF4272 domain-containing protein [Dactylosporangium matsuzakiense]GLL04000.1 hypothetical protein GCM10017581_057470 [Dactylosporangium matsuzakiense]